MTPPTDPLELWDSIYWTWMRQLHGEAAGAQLERDFKDAFFPFAPLSGPAASVPKPPQGTSPEHALWNQRPQAQAPSRVGGHFRGETAQRTFDDLILPLETRKALTLAMDKIIHARTIYDEFNMKSVDSRSNRTVLNFAGPPGTGKTLAAHAVAHHLNRRIVVVDHKEIESSWLGESQKNLSGAFAAARRERGVLFFDEADAMLGGRVLARHGGDNHVNSMRSIILTELEQFDGIAIFATNRVGNYDRAFARRILAHVPFELPDIEQRQKLWERHLPPELPRGPQVTCDWLAASTEGFSGGDILNAALLMATAAAGKSRPNRKVTRQDAEAAVALVRRGLESIGVNP